jgi:hypothetical protein
VVEHSRDARRAAARSSQANGVDHANGSATETVPAAVSVGAGS